MNKHQERANKRIKRARKSPHYWASKIADEFMLSIRDKMSELELNDSQLAEKADVSRQYISKIMNGHTNFTVESMAKIALALESRVSDIELVNLSANRNHNTGTGLHLKFGASSFIEADKDYSFIPFRMTYISSDDCANGEINQNEAA